MNQTQIDGITKARLLANIDRAGTGLPQFVDNDAYVAHVCAAAGIEALPDAAADSYAATHAEESIAALEARLAVALAEPEAAPPPAPPEPVAPPLDQAKKARREDVNAIIDARTVLKGPGAVCATPVGVMQCDQNSRINITGAVVLAQLRMQMGQPFELPWTRADNTQALLTGPTMIAMGSAVAAHVAAVHMAGRAIKAAIDAAADADALAAIDIYAGWP